MLYLVTLGAELRERGVGVHVIEQGIDTATGRSVEATWNDRDTLMKQVAAELDCYGWDAVTWPDEISTEMTIPLARNTSGHRIDEAERLHQAAGVTYHKAHHAYISAVAATVEAAGTSAKCSAPAASRPQAVGAVCRSFGGYPGRGRSPASTRPRASSPART